VRSPTKVALTAHANNLGSAPAVSLSDTSFDFQGVRLRTQSPVHTFTVTTRGTAAWRSPTCS
jgi:hypothetical protein